MCACSLITVSKAMQLSVDWFSMRSRGSKARLHVYLVASSKSEGSFDRVVLIHVDKSTSLKVCLLSEHTLSCLVRVWEKLSLAREAVCENVFREPVAVCPLVVCVCVSTRSQFNPQAPWLCSHWLLSFTHLPIGPLGAHIGTRYPISDLDYPIRRLMYVLKASHPRIIRH